MALLLLVVLLLSLHRWVFDPLLVVGSNLLQLELLPWLLLAGLAWILAGRQGNQR